MKVHTWGMRGGKKSTVRKRAEGARRSVSLKEGSMRGHKGSKTGS